MKIKELHIEHYKEVYTLWESCEGVGLSDADSKESIESYLKRNPNMSFVAINDGIICGAILCGHDGRRGYIHHLAVDVRYRKKGVAKELVRRSLKTLYELNIKKCHIFIFNNNIAMDFWKKNGWNYRNDIGVMSYQS